MARTETFETETMTIKFIERGCGSLHAMARTTRVYIEGISDLADVKASNIALPASMCKGENAATDKAYAKHNRLYARHATRIALEAIKAAESILLGANDSTKARFSRTAGCSCPCSPGVILSDKIYLERTWNTVDVRITLK